MISKVIAALTLAAGLAGTAAAQDWYVSGSIGVAQQSDSDNSGSADAFTTGNLGDGSTLPVEAGTPYGWQTEFDSGLSIAGELGARVSPSIRAGVELSYTQADVDTHNGVFLADIDLTDVDAAALAGAPDPLGVSVGDLVADGQGELTTLSVFANAYYDFNTGGQIQPYVGAGIGFMDVDVEYAPSGVGIIDDGETVLAWQVKAGASFQVSDQWDIFGEYTYRQSDDIETENSLFPGTLDIENQQNVFAIGARYTFGS